MLVRVLLYETGAPEIARVAPTAAEVRCSTHRPLAVAGSTAYSGVLERARASLFHPNAISLRPSQRCDGPGPLLPERHIPSLWSALYLCSSSLSSAISKRALPPGTTSFPSLPFLTSTRSLFFLSPPLSPTRLRPTYNLPTFFHQPPAVVHFHSFKCPPALSS